MRYFILGADAERHLALGPKDPALWEFFLEQFDEPNPFSSWVPFEVERISDQIPESLGQVGFGDIINFNLTPICVFPQRTAERLAPLLEASGELLPIIGVNQTFYLYHVTTVLNALDEEKSVVERFSNGKIMRVIKYVLKEDVLDNHDIFRISGDKWKVFVSERFVKEVEKQPHDGFVFSCI